MANDDIRLELTIDGKPVVVEPLEVTGAEWREIRKATGLTVKQTMEGIAELDLEAVAGLVWNALRRDDPSVTVDGVLDGLTLRSLVDASGPVEVDESDPSV